MKKTSTQRGIGLYHAGGPGERAREEEEKKERGRRRGNENDSITLHIHKPKIYTEEVRRNAYYNKGIIGSVRRKKRTGGGVFLSFLFLALF